MLLSNIGGRHFYSGAVLPQKIFQQPCMSVTSSKRKKSWKVFKVKICIFVTSIFNRLYCEMSNFFVFSLTKYSFSRNLISLKLNILQMQPKSENMKFQFTWQHLSIKRDSTNEAGTTYNIYICIYIYIYILIRKCKE